MESTGYKDGSAILQALLKTSGQTIVFGRSEDKCSAAVLSSEVRVEVGATDHTSGSSEIATRNVTNYPWDQNYLTGSLVAVHCSGAYLAYAIKAPQKSSGMVRIMHRKSGDRGLVKNIRGMVRDLAFAHLNHRIILAFTDQFGTLYIWEVTPSDTEGQLNTEPILEVSSTSEEVSDHHRVIWCPYIPDDQLDQSGSAEDDNDEPAWLLVLTHGPTAEIWNVSGVIRSNGGGVVTRGEVRSGYQVMEQHSGPITDAAFSPDGTALATASLDGTVKFFQVGQVYMADEERSPRCLHQWNPHDGKPLSSLFFLDNHKHPSPDVQFWKYAVTGACNNSELRVWSCESWQCHQTLRFVPSQQDPPPQPLTLKAAMDPSAGFLLLSDIHRRVVYVVVVNQEVGSNGPSLSVEVSNTNSVCNSKNNNSTGGSARMVSVSELPVQYPSLFLAITDAAWKPYKRWKHDHGHDHAYNAHGDDMEDDGSGADMVQGVVMRWLLINTKSLQEATLRFQPQTPQALPTTTQSLLDLSSSQDSLVVRDGLTDLSMSFSASLSEVEADGGGLESQPPPPPPPDALTHGLTSPQMSMNLLTPDSFSSPRKPEDCDNSEEVQDNGSQASQGSGDAPLAVSETCGSVTANGGRGTSATSSPSLEVQQILQDQNGKNCGIEDEGGEEEAELAEEDAAEDEEPEAHRHPQPVVPGPPSSQSHMHIPLSLAQTPHSSMPSSLPSPPQPQNIIRGSLPQLPQAQTSLALPQLPTVSQQPSSSPLPLASPQPLPMTSPRPHTAPHDQRNNNNTASLPQASPNNVSSHSSHHTPLTSPHDPHLPLASPQPLPQGKLSLTSPKLPQTTAHLPHTSPQLVPLSSVQQPPLDFIKSIASDNSITATQDVLKSIQRQTSTDITSQVLGGLNQMTCAQLEAEIKGSAAASTNHTLPDPRSGNTPASHSPGTSATMSSSSSLGGQRRNVNESPGSILLNDLRSIVGSEIAPPSHHNGPIAQPAAPGVTSEDIAELRSLLVSSMDLQRKQSTESVTSSKLLSSKLDKAIQQMDQLAKQVHEMKQSQTTVQRELPRLIEATLRSEIRTTVTPGIAKSLDPLRTQLSSEVERIVKNTESQILDAVNRFIHSRSFVEVVSSSVGTAVAPAVQVSCREAYNKLVLPGFNSLTQQVFTQVNEAFSRGTREYLQNVEGEMGVGRTAIQESVTKATATLNLTCNSLAGHSKSLQENITKLNQQHTSLCEGVSERVRCLVREEMGQCLQEHQANLDARSRAHTPAPMTQHTINPKVAQQQVQTLISQGQFNAAFKQALSASDLSLVVFVCERVNPQQVFNQTPCPLTQDVLLSLVNQLSHDLATFTDLKMKYLEEAVMNLDVSHPVTREHMRGVLQGFQRNLQAYQHLNPTNKKVKMLVMAVTHLINS